MLFFVLKQISHIENEAFCLFPAETGVCDGFAEYLVGLLASVLKIALYHKSLDQLLDVGRIVAAVNYLLGNSYLLKILFAGV